MDATFALLSSSGSVSVFLESTCFSEMQNYYEDVAWFITNIQLYYVSLDFKKCHKFVLMLYNRQKFQQNIIRLVNSYLLEVELEVLYVALLVHYY